MKVQSWRDDSVSKDNWNNDGEFSPEKIDVASDTKGIKKKNREKGMEVKGAVRNLRDFV